MFIPASWRSSSVAKFGGLVGFESVWSDYSELTVSSLLKYEVVISEHVGFSAHGRPERGESAGKTHDPAGPRGAAGASWVFVVRFRSALAGHV